MLRYCLLQLGFLTALILVGLVVSCTARNPLDTPVLPPTPINGQITVTALNATTPTGGVSVQVVAPSGAVQQLVTNGSAAQGLIGQAIFKEPVAGNYKVLIPNQPAAVPSAQYVQLSPSQPYAAISVQTSGQYLSVTASDGKALSFMGGVEYHAFSITYVNTTAYQQDVVLVPDTSVIPAGWTVNLTSNHLSSGQTTQAVVATSNLSQGTIPLRFLAMLGSTTVAQGQVVLAQNWSLSVTRNYYTATCCGSGTPAYMVVTVSSVNCPNLPGTLILAGIPLGTPIPTTGGSTGAMQYGTIGGIVKPGICTGYSGSYPSWWEYTYGPQVLASGADSPPAIACSTFNVTH